MAHLHLLLAADSPTAILIKHGPGSGSCTVGWDREQDTFQIGQCLRLRIQHPDVSPDGRYFSYFAASWNPCREHECYRVISRSPWIKALTFWGSGGGHIPGASLFLASDPDHPEIYAPSGCAPPDWDHLGVGATSRCPPGWRKAIKDGLQAAQWRRDGWAVASPWEISQPGEASRIPGREKDRKTRRMRFEKPLPEGWRMEMTWWCENNCDQSLGSGFETFALISPRNEVHQMPDWISADFDAPRNRVVWTADNMLYAALLKSTGLEEAKVLWDGRELKFTPIKAPY